MTYRDDLEAMTARAEALEVDLEEQKRLNEQLRAGAKAKPAASPRVRTPSPVGPDPAPLADPTDLDLGASARCFALGIGNASCTLTLGFYAIWLPVSFVLFRVFAIFSNGRDLAIVLLVPCVANVALGIAGVALTYASLPHERRWPQQLPFKLHGYFGLFDRSRSVDERRKFRAIVHFAQGVTPPTVEAFENIFDVLLLPKIAVGTTTVTLDCTAAPTTMNWRSFRNLHDASHAIVDVFVGLHETRPIDRIELLQIST